MLKMMISSDKGFDDKLFDIRIIILGVAGHLYQLKYFPILRKLYVYNENNEMILYRNNMSSQQVNKLIEKDMKKNKRR